MKLILTNEDVKCAIRNYVKEKVILPDNTKITATRDDAIVEWETITTNKEDDLYASYLLKKQIASSKDFYDI